MSEGRDYTGCVECAACLDPGVCCRQFRLGEDGGELTFWLDPREGEDTPEAYLERWGLPFRLLRLQPVPQLDPEMRPYGLPVFTCPLLGEDGRCTAYEDRPDMCRRYAPGADGLCALHPDHAATQADLASTVWGRFRDGGI